MIHSLEVKNGVLEIRYAIVKEEDSKPEEMIFQLNGNSFHKLSLALEKIIHEPSEKFRTVPLNKLELIIKQRSTISSIQMKLNSRRSLLHNITFGDGKDYNTIEHVRYLKKVTADELRLLKRIYKGAQRGLEYLYGNSEMKGGMFVVNDTFKTFDKHYITHKKTLNKIWK